MIGNDKPVVIDRDVDLATVRFAKQRADSDAGRLARLDVVDEVIQRQAGVNNIFDDQDVPAFHDSSGP